MDFKEIRQIIINLKNEEEIEKFVNDRIDELEKDSVEKTVGQNYTTTFSEYISSKIHYKPVDKPYGQKCADLVYDDKQPYIDLIKRLNQGYNLYTLFNDVYYSINKYMANTIPNEGIAMEKRGNLYAWTDRVSIKTIKENGVAMCSENAGLSHNMFRLLGIDSQLVCGYRNGEPHAYNIIYANGKGIGPMVIFDPSYEVKFNNNGVDSSYGFFSFLSDEDYERLVNGNEIKVDLSMTEKGYRKSYIGLENCKFISDEPIYIMGLENNKSKIM